VEINLKLLHILFIQIGVDFEGGPDFFPAIRNFLFEPSKQGQILGKIIVCKGLLNLLEMGLQKSTRLVEQF